MTDGAPDYDLVVIGSGPGGQKAAVAASKLGKKVSVVEKVDMLGGVCTNTGTIPSKTLREAVLYLTGMNQRELYGADYRVKSDITVSDLLARTEHVIGREIQTIRAQLQRNHVDMLTGTGSFVDEHTIAVSDTRRGERRTITADKVVIAVGTTPAHPASINFDEDRVLDSDGILDLEKIPSSLTVVGAGVTGIEYASMFAALGTRVTVVEKRDSMLGFCDAETVESLRFHLRDSGVTFRFGEEVVEVTVNDRGTITNLKSGKSVPADMVMYSAGRQGSTGSLELGTRAWRPTTAAASRSTSTTAPASSTSTPWGTSSGSRRWPPRRWTRAGSRPTTRSASPATSCWPCSPSASTRSPSCPTWAGPRSS